MSLPKELVIYLPAGEVDPPVNPYGRLIANAGLYRALVRYGGYQSLHIQGRKARGLDQLARELFISDASGVTLSSGSPLSTERPARAGVLLSGQPYLSELAWIRRHASRDHAYSIVGSIFAFAAATSREQMMGSAMAPLHDWDALICTSPTLQAAVQRTFDRWEDYLRERTGATRLPRPALPVIPLAVDVDLLGAQRADAGARAALRAAHQIAPTDVLVLFLGRLSFYDKAFPQAMFKAVEEAQRLSGVRAHFVMAGWFPLGDADEARFREAAQCYSANVNTIFLNGNDPAVVAQCWAAADIFLLLSDTILETFGQAPVEAMAAGLPVVVSDWDGYRSIVRDGADGYLVPTLGAAAGPMGETLALLQSLEMANWGQYLGGVAQHTAVHIGRAAQALSRLMASAELRERMGAEGKSRARELFSWPVVVKQYQELFSELTDRRLSATSESRSEGIPSHRMNPLRGDPFLDFKDYSTAVMGPTTRLRLLKTDGHDPLGSNPVVGLDHLFPGLRGSLDEARQVVRMLQAEEALTEEEVAQRFPPNRRPLIRMTLAWLAKLGVIDWFPAD